MAGILYTRFVIPWILSGSEKEKHYFRNGLLLMLCICMMFPVTFGMTRYLPPVFHHPVWFWGEWSEQKVHSWDPWNSGKYVDLEDVITAAIGRTTEITGNIFAKSPLLLKTFAAETVKEQALPDEQATWNQWLIRKTIYNHYWKNLNMFGHTQENQGFQLFFFLLDRACSQYLLAICNRFWNFDVYVFYHIMHKYDCTFDK